MGYHLGVDIGTTYTAAATVSEGGQPTMVGLGNRALQIPSVLYFHPDGSVLVGEAAELRSSSDPARTVREFKRRMGDPVPILVAGRPYSAQTLSGRLLRWVVNKSTELMGERPLDITLTYPANWTGFKVDLLRQVAMLADIDIVRVCTEPEAAALQYASRTKVSVGDRIAVYDLGGGTFDVCVLEKTATGFRIPGRPEGIEHLGGIDFDEAIFQRVLSQLPPGAVDPTIDDDAQMAALGRLRRDCVEAKEALSTDTDVSIPFAYGHTRTSVRLIRGEFEDIIRPALEDTIGATRRALRSADTDPSALKAMVLVGGSSRIPLVAELLGNEFRCPIAVDTHPKNDVAMGAARAGTLQDAATLLITPGMRPAGSPDAARSFGDTGPRPAVHTGGTTTPESDQPVPVPPPVDVPRPETTPESPPPSAVGRRAAATGPHPLEGSVTPAAPSTSTGTPEPSDDARRRRQVRTALIAAAVAVVVVGASIIATRVLGGGSTVAGTAIGTTSATSSTAPSPSPSPSTVASSTVESPTPTSPSVQLSPAGLPISDPLPANQLIAPRTVQDNLDLYLVDAAAGTVGARLTTSTSEDRTPILSPDRRSIIYSEQTDSTRELRVMAADGTGDRPLFATPPAGCVRANRPAWNPVDPTELVLVCIDGQNAYSMPVVGLGGQIRRQLATGIPRVDDVAYSPDGTTIVYWGSEPSELDGGSIYTIPADGSGPPVRLTEQKVGTDADPIFSPDGTEIVFRRRMPNDTARGNFDLYVMKPDGSDLRQLTNHMAHDQDPTFSPDGTQIVFKSDRDGPDASGASHLWIMAGDGLDQRPLLPDDGSRDESATAWGPR